MRGVVRAGGLPHREAERWLWNMFPGRVRMGVFLRVPEGAMALRQLRGTRIDDSIYVVRDSQHLSEFGI